MSALTPEDIEFMSEAFKSMSSPLDPELLASASARRVLADEYIEEIEPLQKEVEKMHKITKIVPNSKKIDQAVKQRRSVERVLDRLESKKNSIKRQLEYKNSNALKKKLIEASQKETETLKELSSLPSEKELFDYSMLLFKINSREKFAKMFGYGGMRFVD